MRKQYSIWQKLLMRNRPGLTPEQVLTAKDRLQITQVLLVLGAIVLNVAIIYGIAIMK